jgi:hypothetical protein
MIDGRARYVTALGKTGIRYSSNLVTRVRVECPWALMLSLGACVVICVNNVRIVSRSALRSDDTEAVRSEASDVTSIGSSCISRRRPGGAGG